MSQPIQPANSYASSQKSKKAGVTKKINVELKETSSSSLVSKRAVDTVNRLKGFSFNSPSVDKPLFHFFESQNQIPKAILTKQQEELIHQLFQARYLDSRLCLIDLLGNEIYIRLNNLLGSNEEALEVFGVHMCMTYLLEFRRFQMQKNGIPVSFDNPQLKQFYSPQKIEKFFGNTLTKLINTAAELKKVNIATRDNLSDAMKRSLIQTCETWREQLSGYVEIFNILLKHEKGSLILIDNSILRLSGAENLNRENKDLELNDLKNFITYVDTLFTAGQKLGAISVVSPCFLKIKNHIEKKEWQHIQPLLLQAYESLYQRREDQIKAHELAEAGELTQKQWAAANGMEITDPKTQEGFTEWLNLVVLAISLNLMFLEDIQTLIDRYFDRYIPELFFPKKRIVQRILLNLSVLTDPPAIEMEVVQQTLGPLFQPLFDQASQFLQNYPLLTNTKPAHISQMKQAKKEFESQLPKEITDEEFFTRSAAVERGVDEEISKLVGSESLQEISGFYKRFIQNELPSTLSSLIESLSECSPEQIANARKDIFKVGLPVIRIGMILRDLEALKEQRYPTDEQLQPQLLNLLTLKGLETAVQRKKQEKDTPPAQSEEVLVQLPSEREELAPLTEPEQELVSSQQSPVLSSRRSKSVQQKPKTASVQEQETFTVSQNTRIREVEAQLEQLGLVPLRSKGSHTYYGIPKKGNQPAQFVTQVSHHSGGGSVGPISKKIERQVNAFLEKKEKAPKN